MLTIAQLKLALQNNEMELLAAYRATEIGRFKDLLIHRAYLRDTLEDALEAALIEKNKTYKLAV